MDILVCWIGKIVRICAPGGSRTLDFLRARRAPYPLDQALGLASGQKGKKVFIFGPGHVTKMAAMPICDKNLLKIFSRITGPFALKLGIVASGELVL